MNKNELRQSDNMIKIKFEVENYGEKGSMVESIWATPTSERGVYRLENSPFYVYGYSFNDLINAKEKDEDLYATGIYRRSGHSNYRIFLKEGISFEKFSKQWTHLENLQCSFEQAQERLFAVDVPTGVNLDEVEMLLKDGEDAGVWDYETGYCHKN